MNNSKKNSIILLNTSRASVKKVKKHLGDKKFKWIYFGEDIAREIFIAPLLNKSGSKLEIGDRLQVVAEELRQDYIDYIGRLSLENSSLRWWLSSVSEKNPLVSKNFLHICYNKVALDLISEIPFCYVFLSDHEELRNSLLNNISSENSYIVKEIKPPFDSFLRTFQDWTVMFLIKIWFLFECLNRIILSKLYFRFIDSKDHVKSKDKEFCFVHTWIDQRSFDEKDRFSDSYFNDLSEYLRKFGRRVLIVPYVLSNLSYRDALRKMKSSKEEFILPYFCIGFKEVLKVIWAVVKNKPTRKDYPSFNRMDISNLIYGDQKNDWIGIRTPRDLILYYFVKGWKRKGIKIESFIHTYENNTWEKVYNIAFRKYYPETNIIGYQHSAIPKMLVNYFISSVEKEIIPLPDRIITNGEYPRKLFLESGYGSDLIVAGGAIRYSNLLKMIETKAISTYPKKFGRTVLLTTSIILTDAAELTLKTVEALKNSDYTVILKTHPVMPYIKFSKYLGLDALPNNFQLSNTIVSELLKLSDVLIYSCTSTSVEALVMGVPPIHVKSDHAVDMDQLDFAPHSRVSVRTPEELRKAVEKVLAMSPQELSKRKAEWKKIVGQVFGTVTNKTYTLFLMKKDDDSET
jgi:hypothetical protein